VASVARPDVEEMLPTLEGRAVSFGLELAANDVLAEAHATLAPTEARMHLFAGIDASLAGRLAPGDVVVAEEVTGNAAAARPAIVALAAAGITAIVAQRIASEVTNAAHGQGVVTIIVDTPSFLHTGDRMRLDLDAAKIVNLSSGDRAVIRNLDEAERARLRATFTLRRQP
jgi:3-isopropylmalate/(R)-2-methylmalate dehydratase small subunit